MKLYLYIYIFFFFYFVGWSESESTWYVDQYLAYCTKTWMIDNGGAVSGMRISRGNRSTLRKAGSVLLHPLQTPHDLTWDQTQAAMVGSQQLTA
jgi:hypothetical protein